MVSVTIELPDDVAKVLGEHDQMSRSILEATLADSYRTGKLTRFQVRQALNLDRWETEVFLDRHEAQRPFSLTDYELERQSQEKFRQK